MWAQWTTRGAVINRMLRVHFQPYFTLILVKAYVCGRRWEERRLHLWALRFSRPISVRSSRNRKNIRRRNTDNNNMDSHAMFVRWSETLQSNLTAMIEKWLDAGLLCCITCLGHHTVAMPPSHITTMTCLQVTLMVHAAIRGLKKLDCDFKKRKNDSLKTALSIFNCAYSNQNSCFYFPFKAVGKIKYHLHKSPWSKMALNFFFCTCKRALNGPPRATWYNEN